MLPGAAARIRGRQRRPSPHPQAQRCRRMWRWRTPGCVRRSRICWPRSAQESCSTRWCLPQGILPPPRPREVSPHPTPVLPAPPYQFACPYEAIFCVRCFPTSLQPRGPASGPYCKLSSLRCTSSELSALFSPSIPQPPRLRQHTYSELICLALDPSVSATGQLSRCQTAVREPELLHVSPHCPFENDCEAAVSLAVPLQYATLLRSQIWVSEGFLCRRGCGDVRRGAGGLG